MANTAAKYPLRIRRKSLRVIFDFIYKFTVLKKNNFQYFTRHYKENKSLTDGRSKVGRQKVKNKILLGKIASDKTSKKPTGMTDQGVEMFVGSLRVHGVRIAICALDRSYERISVLNKKHSPA